MELVGVAPTTGPARPVVLTVHIDQDGQLGTDYRVTAQVDDTDAPVEPPVPGRFVAPALESDSGANPRSSTQAEEAGAVLFDAVFAGSLRRLWARAVEGARRASGLQLVVRGDAAVIRMLPWELLFDRVLVRGHLALVDGWSVIRQIGPGTRPPPAPHDSADELQIAVLVAGDVNFDTAQDVALLSESWPTGHLRVDTHATLESLTADVAHLLHLVPAGVPGTDGWHSLLLTDPSASTGSRSVSGTELVAALRSVPVPPEIVVLASCDTDQIAADLAAVVPTVLGFRGRVSDAACVEFLRGFYTALAGGRTVDQAASAGRLILRGSGALAREWALPVLYAEPGQRLVRPPGPVPVPQAPSAPALESVGPADESLERTLDRMNLQALTARWGPVEPALWPDLVRQHEALLVSRLEDDDRPRLVTR